MSWAKTRRISVAKRWSRPSLRRAKATKNAYGSPMKRSVVKYKYSDGSTMKYHRVKFARF